MLAARQSKFASARIAIRSCVALSRQALMEAKAAGCTGCRPKRPQLESRALIHSTFSSTAARRSRTRLSRASSRAAQLRRQRVEIGIAAEQLLGRIPQLRASVLGEQRQHLGHRPLRIRRGLRERGHGPAELEHQQSRNDRSHFNPRPGVPISGGAKCAAGGEMEWDRGRFVNPSPLRQFWSASRRRAGRQAPPPARRWPASSGAGAYRRMPSRSITKVGR